MTSNDVKKIILTKICCLRYLASLDDTCFPPSIQLYWLCTFPVGACISTSPLIPCNISITWLSKHVCTNVSPPNAFSQFKKIITDKARGNKKVSPSFQQVHKKLDELLENSRLLLMPNMHPNTAFWQLNREQGANARWGSGTKCYQRYGLGL